MPYLEFAATSLKMLIDANILKPGTNLYAESDDSASALLNADGSISLTIEGNLKEYQSPSAAAKALTGKSLNGWVFWKVDESGQINTLASFRSKYDDVKS
jgi:hypothetical protein